MTAILETPRLLLRPPRLSDAGALFEFLGDKEAMRFTHVQSSLRHCRRYIALHERQRRTKGCAPWVIVAKTNNAIIGYGGLYDDPFDPGWGIELAYFFSPAAWGHGYATEFALGCLNFAETGGRWPEISAFAHPENRRSQAVLSKAGFLRQRYVPGMKRDLFLWRSQPR
jgi:RimJ/RimL family protein N-acetyltransferase